MKNHLDNMKSFLSETDNYSVAVEAIAIACSSLIASNPDLETDFIDEFLKRENELRGQKLPESVSYRNLTRELYCHMKALVFACFRETIAKDEEVQLPKLDTNGDALDDLIPDEISQKYEVIFSNPQKYQEYDYARVTINVSGQLKKLFDKHECANLSFEMIFHADQWADYVTFYDQHDLYLHFDKISVNKSVLPERQRLESLVSDIKNNPNHHLLTHLLKCSAL